MYLNKVKVEGSGAYMVVEFGHLLVDNTIHILAELCIIVFY